MKVTLTPSRLAGTVGAISSKSDVHRILLAAMLAKEATRVYFNTFSEDIRATLDCIAALGAKIEERKDGVTVHPGSAPRAVHLNCRESGSTARFILPVAAVLCESAKLTGSGRLPQRPFDDVCLALEANGCGFDSFRLPLTVTGPLQPGAYRIRGSVSSQYISGLLFALPLLSSDSEIVLTTPLQSASYVEMTLYTLAAFGIKIEKTPSGFSVPGRQQYVSPKKIHAEGDWSNAAFFRVAAELCGTEIEIKGLREDSLQGDRAIDEVIALYRDDALHTVYIDAENIPDLVPVLAVLASGKRKKTVIRGAERLRLKESDRLGSVSAMISALGGSIDETDDGLIITGAGSLSGGKVDSFADHRIAMSAAIAALICEGPVTILGAQAVGKSYPNFFEDYKMLGGKVQ